MNEAPIGDENFDPRIVQPLSIYLNERSPDRGRKQG